ncbi:MAG: GAF domain-containing protein [Bacteroidota bacterium]|nr:GAF domain-containing protein [Bacteroidota bacterium]
MKLQNDYLYFKDEIFPPMPFDIRLSLERIFQYWENKASQGSPSEQIHAKSILDAVAHAAVLRHPISDIQLIETYAAEIEILLSAMFPDILSTNEIKAASLPFYPVLFNMSKRMKGIIQKAGPDFQMGIKGFDPDELYVLGCSFLISVIYKVNINFKRPVYFDIPDQESGIERHYRAFINGDFGNIIPKENFQPLSPEDIQLLIDNSRDLELWKKMIPPGTFVYEGVALITLFDQTEEEALSELKQQLLENNALQNEASLNRLQDKLAQYLGVDKIELGFEAFDEEGANVKALHGAVRPSKLLGDNYEESVEECFCDYSFEALLKQRDFFAISNVRELKDAPSQFIKRMYDVGVGSFIVAPLKFNDKIIAFIELTSSQQGTLNSMVASKLRNVLPMFTVAVSRSIDNHQTELESIVQEKYTSIHPTVSWKFFSSAEKIYQNRITDNGVDTEDISFSDVYPLYGQFDIRGSSDARNASIRHDLLAQLDMADAVLLKASTYDRLPIYQQLLFRINVFRQALTESINAGDEVKILDFIHRELDPVFDHLLTIAQVAPAVKSYRDALDPVLGVIYRQRKEYETSVTMINERIAEYIEDQQTLAQKMFPHYFEKYKTDGVEYNAYIGQSLIQNKTYHPLHLKNLRLWQLLITCGVENLHEAYKHELPMPLGITSLILAHSNPLAIRFRLDEKRFDVDGAYNIRYEILKKRIDKAYIKDTTERLTQPGKLSIVYSQDWEADEYLQYLQYLQSIDYLDGQIEKLELQDLQGTSGLQALRVGIRYEVSPDMLIKEMMQESLA